MFKQALFSAAAAALLLSGCGDDTQTLQDRLNDAKAGPVDASYAAVLAGSIVKAVEADTAADATNDVVDTSTMAVSTASVAPAAVLTLPCANGGTVSLDELRLTSNPSTLTVNGTFDQCKNDLNITQDGSVGFVFTKIDQTLSGTERFRTDFTRTGGLFDFKFYEDSFWTLTHTEGDDFFDALKSYIISIDGNKIGADGWRHRHFTAPQKGWCPVEGRVLVNNLDYYYTVDPAYDACTTPFLLNDQNVVQVGGESRYVGKNGGKFQIIVETEGYFTVNFDTDGDGNFDNGSIVLPQ